MEEFECQWKPGKEGTYSRKFVEFCNTKMMTLVSQNIPERIKDGSFTRLTFDMMLAWQQPDADDNQSHLVPNLLIIESLNFLDMECVHACLFFFCLLVFKGSSR